MFKIMCSGSKFTDFVFSGGTLYYLFTSDKSKQFYGFRMDIKVTI